MEEKDDFEDVNPVDYNRDPEFDPEPKDILWEDNIVGYSQVTIFDLVHGDLLEESSHQDVINCFFSESSYFLFDETDKDVMFHDNDDLLEKLALSCKSVVNATFVLYKGPANKIYVLQPPKVVLIFGGSCNVGEHHQLRLQADAIDSPVSRLTGMGLHHTILNSRMNSLQQGENDVGENLREVFRVANLDSFN